CARVLLLAISLGGLDSW
nr:immunoglobulin heavy chain junction region [Macaca mulatta]MOW23429.1 immunoglobulin heavy chain junction region [Macaca mulatta]MOW24078.1 immunoglobulin heavy chain junction region [Macaca mulatta]MOW24276.1 immunoglobulin heavy chain junction region [Macaca mulatta]MOW25263.1 immunoglobulin heavy chain junction region [Macaca mulatta]